MKKYSFLVAALFVLLICLTAFAADGEWTAWDADLSGAAEIACEIVTPATEYAEYRDILGVVTEDDWAVGPEDAPMTLIEYADFQCPYCSNAGLIAIEFQKAHPDEVRYVYRHFPLSFHEKAPMSAYAADAAGKQGLFFEAEAFLYETQNDWTYLETLDEFDAWLRENIQTALPELDYEQWVADYESEAVHEAVDGAFDKVAATGIVSGTPTFFANFFQVSYDPETLEQYLNLFRTFKNYRTTCPVAAVEEGKEYRAVVHTTQGDVVIDLLAEQAPNLVSSFMQLARDGWYNGNTFHNVVDGFVAQTGDPSKTGVGMAGFYVADENLNSGAFSKPGAVAMANTGENKNSSQFFITMDLNSYYTNAFSQQDASLTAEELQEKADTRVEIMNSKYSVFGYVSEESLEVLPLITTDTVIESIDIEVRG